ncbi:winged helix-turn-helix transcriptional regulator [Chitinophaga nivalis]|uniref:Helix-turn-helix transcriptional regulator n=1 Tax=Chitinophaga nivalis TaxID=2991709 RepID=A0ABT3IFB7_9BACT|nr:helix-turn-helix domain-containing protein [Chitinophaga nivalis]MCW3467656.1 helix-turn-helix transcriptional regulator [Chitinophaga nivalis]MCW3482652.1 helix-turn-helix transcriptional regulator [Chitinophaga nivalis]
MTKRKEQSTNSLNKQLMAGNCDLVHAIDLIGGRWKLVILSNLETAAVRFSELKRLIPQISERMLVLQLKEMEKAGLITRTAYATVPPCVAYSLTAIGKELMPIWQQLSQWGSKHKTVNNEG